MRETSRPSIFWFVAALVLPFMDLAAKYVIVDGEKLPKSGTFVLAPNHYSEIDPLVVGRVVWRLGRTPRFLAKASLFKIPFMGWILRRSGQIPVERAGSVRDNQPVKAVQELVEKDRLVVVYPEGSLTRDPELWPMRGKTGAVRMSLQYGIPVIPVAHWGTQQIMARYSKKISLFPRKVVTVKFGDPVDLSAFANRPLDSATLNEATTKVMDSITELLEDVRGEIAPDERWNPSQHNQKDIGRFD